MRANKGCVYSVFHIFIYSQCPIDYNGNISLHRQFPKRIDALIVDIYMNVTKNSESCRSDILVK